MDAKRGHGRPDEPRLDTNEVARPIRLSLMLEIHEHVDAALDDLRRSVAHNRPITLSNLRRLFARRWARATWRADPSGARVYRFGLACGSASLIDVYHEVRAAGAEPRRRKQTPFSPGMTWSPRF